MTRSTTAPPDPAPPGRLGTTPRPKVGAANLKVPGTFRFDLRDATPFAHLPDTPLVIQLRERAVLGEARA